ncbi:hypothetical protein INS49_005732 [Diaporthe citri]|uniref:uncharacterized protein n=1 Tax=Diaporthe citri TaxID=83186 RepID=UPI001C812243|nr:uncharacterized protein INS49_005732 [Diaporthe citri]KAG6364134.1 hypothetical protein INS49_005732 [Diaporthe citri]
MVSLNAGGTTPNSKRQKEKLREATGPFTDEVVPSVSSSRGSISQLASRPSVLDRGPFPLCRGDFGHNNIIVDDTDHIIGVTDRETAFAGPWEIFADSPLDPNQDGSPKAADLAQKLADQEDCVEDVAAGENRGGGGQPSPVRNAEGLKEAAVGN